MKSVEEIEQIRKQKREELDLRVNLNSATREKHILVCRGTGCTSSKSPEIIENFKKIIDLNVNAVFNCSRAVVDYMKKNGGGVILNTSSMVSIYGQPSGCGYPASKFAVNGLTKSLARELGKDNIRVNAVAPGVTLTDMMKDVPDSVIEPIIKEIPLGRIGTPEDIANAFLFLASDMASYITGVILSVDGAARS